MVSNQLPLMRLEAAVAKAKAAFQDGPWRKMLARARGHAPYSSMKTLTINWQPKRAETSIRSKLVECMLRRTAET
jgi:hypothetical protein